MNQINATPQALKERIKTMFDILCTAQEALKIVKFLTEYGSPKDKFFKKTNHFLVWSALINWRLVVLELTKLLSEGWNHYHSLEKLFAEIRKDAGLLALIPETEINQWELALLTVKAKIDKLKEQRDKVYAHTDINSDKVVNDVSVVEAQGLIELIQGFLNSILKALSEPPYEFFLLGEPKDNLENIVTALIERDNILEQAEKELNEN